jgi:hypothetical protein
MASAWFGKAAASSGSPARSAKNTPRQRIASRRPTLAPSADGEGARSVRSSATPTTAPKAMALNCPAVVGTASTIAAAATASVARVLPVAMVAGHAPYGLRDHGHGHGRDLEAVQPSCVE